MIYGGLPYFPHETTSSDELSIIQGMYGMAGYGVVYKLYERIFSRGYYCDWTERICRVFSINDCRLKPELVSKIVASCVDEGVFDGGMYKKYSVLTSADIQMKFWNAAKNRKNLKMRSEILLIDIVPKENGKAQNEQKTAIFERFLEATNKVEFISTDRLLKPWLEFFEPDVILFAFRVCERKGRLDADYLTGILRNWKRRGVMYLEDIDDPMLSVPGELEIISGYITNNR